MKIDFNELYDWDFCGNFSYVFGYTDSRRSCSVIYFPVKKMAYEQDKIIVWASSDERYVLSKQDPVVWNNLIAFVEREI